MAQQKKFNMHRDDFALFRSTTNEIKVISREISKIIQKNPIKLFLDIGVGSGELTNILVKNLKIQESIAIDKNNLFKKKMSNIRYFQKDWLDFAPSKKFDFILSSHSIAYLAEKDIAKAINKMYKFLNHGGKAVIIVYDNQGIWPVFKKLFYPKRQKTSTLDCIRSAIAKKEYKFDEKSFLTKIYANNLEHMLQIGRFLAEKHLSYYLGKAVEAKKFFAKYKTNNGKIIFPLNHRMIILKK